MLIQIFGFLIFIAAVFLGFSAWTGGGSMVVGNAAEKNLCGPVGEFVVVFMWKWLGDLGTSGVIFLLACGGIVFMGKHGLHMISLRIIGSTLFCLSLSVFEYIHVHFDDPYDGPFLAGGFFGCSLGDLALNNLSFLGTYIVAGVVLIVAVVLMTDIMFDPEESYCMRATKRSLRAAGGAVRTGGFVAGGAKRKTGAIVKQVKKLKEKRAQLHEEKKAAKRKKKELEELEDDEYEYIEVEEDEEELPDEEDDGWEYVYEDEEEDEEEKPRKRSKPHISINKQTNSKRKTASKGTASKRRGSYRLPKYSLLSKGEVAGTKTTPEQLEKIAQKIENTLQSFKVDAEVTNVQKGPVITQYEVLPAAGIKVHRISNLAREIAMALKAKKIRIVAPIPGKNTVGIEVPNRQRELVSLRDLLESETVTTRRSKIPILLGKDAAGNAITSDLAQMPHLMIAGATGSGKSVAINSIITTLLMTRSPDELKMILIDPKRVELSDFEDIPHLLCPVVADMKKAVPTLAWLVGTMEKRYEILSHVGARNITTFNTLTKKTISSRIEGKLSEEEKEKFPTSLPYIVVVVDELADLMMTGGKDIETNIIRLAQKSRAVGIHVILATQRPSVDVITGLIKSNMPCRVSFQVSSKIDSRTVLDRNGAEALLGQGDLLFLPPGSSEIMRAQSCFVSDEEIRKVVRYVRLQAEPEFNEELENGGAKHTAKASELDDLYDEAVEAILETGRGSATLLQRRLGVGYTRASRLIDLMTEEGIVGPYKGSKAREVNMTIEEWRKSRN